MTTRNKKLLAMGAAAVALSPLAINPAVADTEDIDMKAIVVKAITITTKSSLDFGTMAGGGVSAGTVTIATDGTRTSAGGVNTFGLDGQQGKFIVKATAKLPIEVKATDTSFTVAHTTKASKTMKVDTFQFEGPGAGPLATLVDTITGTGTKMTISAGAKLYVGATQTAGTYTGTFTVSAIYD